MVRVKITSKITTDNMCELDVFAGNFTLVDWDIHKLWLAGFTANEALTFLNLDLQKEFPEYSHDMMVSDVNDNYRLFAMLENVILSISSCNNPAAVGVAAKLDCGFGQFQLADFKSRARLVESYYSLDSELCREIVGKKLSSRLRKDLDEICDKPSCRFLKLRSARRQYDNVKRIFKTIEEMAGDYVTNIRTQFGLSKELAEKYATLVFAASFRFEVSKKRLNYLTFENIMSISLVLIDDWIEYGGGGGAVGKTTSAAAGGGSGGQILTAVTATTTTGVFDEVGAASAAASAQLGDELYEPTLDKDFLTSLRDLKTLQDRDKEHRNVVCCRLRSANNIISASSGSVPKSSSSSSTLGSSTGGGGGTEGVGEAATAVSTVAAAPSSSSCRQQQQQLSSIRAYQELENGFRNLSRGIVSVAVGLSHNKEVKDFFVHLVEKIVEPLRAMQYVTKDDVNIFLSEYTAAITEVGVFDPAAEAAGPMGGGAGATMMIDNEVKGIFARFMKTLHPAILLAIPD